MILQLFRRFKRKSPHNIPDQFDLLMSRASQLAERENVEGLRDLIKIILRPIQSHHIREAYLIGAHNAPEPLFWSDSLGIDRIIPGLDVGLIEFVWSQRCLIKDKEKYPRLNLASDIVLPTSWHPSSIVLNLGRIGPGLANGSFEQSTNHSVMLSYPLGIGWVANGNHSIVQAVIRGEGVIIPTEVHDLCELIKLIRFDGRVWKSAISGVELGVPRYPEFGWVWEIGRLISSIESSPYLLESSGDGSIAAKV